MKLSAVAAALAIAGGLAFGGQALADTVDANFSLVSGKKGTIYTNQGDGGGGLFASSLQVGSFNGDLSPGGDQFLAFCLQPQEFLDNNNIYTVEALKDAPVTAPGSTMGPAGQTAMEILLGNVFPVFSETQAVQNVTVGGLNQAQQFMALQLAIWEISNERTQGIESYSVSAGSGTFSADAAFTAKIVNQANAWLASLSTDSWKNNQLDNLVALVHATGQDYVVQVVPIPAAAWLFGSALIGTIAIGRRKSKARAQTVA
jgi:hypothetical protein